MSDAGSKTDVWASGDAGGDLRVVAFWESYVVAKKLARGSRLVIGRGTDAGLRIDHPSVSRRHAEISFENGVVIGDLGSANGTVVGGQSLGANARAPWLPGDVVTIGAATLFLQSSAIPRDEIGKGAGAPPPSPAEFPWPAEGPMERISRVLALVAPGDITVLLLGETGVGKELAAESVHRLSRRADRPFVRLNCAALPESLLESELFGYERGAFTGADRAKPGLLESADKGSVFLDEIGEMPLPTQAKLLRVLEAREVMRLGALAPKKVDVRFIAATNRDLGEQVAAGTFRKDLLFRLSGMPVYLPPLRERRNEIDGLARRFAEEASRALGRPVPALSSRALAALHAHSFPGNVRELKNVMERAVLLAGGGGIEPEHLALTTPMTLTAAAEVTLPSAGSVPTPPASGDLDLRRAMADFERDQIARALDAAGGNQTRAAELLGISRRALVDKIREYGLGRGRGR